MAWWGAAGSLALLLVFIFGISLNLARGRTPDCHCFGQLHSAPIGWKTLVRNIVLSAVAVVILWQGRAQPALLGWTRMLGRTELGLVAGGTLVITLITLNIVLWFQMMRQNGRLLLRVEAIEEKLGLREAPPPPPVGLAIGSQAPDFRLDELEGKAVTLKDLRSAGKTVLLLFIEPGCGHCEELLGEAGAWQTRHADFLTIGIISRGDVKANRAKKVKFGLARILLQKDYEVAEAYQCAGTPGAVLVQADGKIGSYVAMGAKAIESLVEQATTPPAAQMGENAPKVRLPDLKGKIVELKSLRGSRVLMLFWNPGCGFCHQILDDLKAWERTPPGDHLKLLVVSAGSVEDNRAQGFLSTVVLDEGFKTGSAFGAGGTPSAVLVDENGKIASKLAVGGPEVMGLVRGTIVN
jgi:peroxiredoxin